MLPHTAGDPGMGESTYTYRTKMIFSPIESWESQLSIGAKTRILRPILVDQIAHFLKLLENLAKISIPQNPIKLHGYKNTWI